MTAWGTINEEAPRVVTAEASDTFWMQMMNISSVTEISQTIKSLRATCFSDT